MGYKLESGLGFGARYNLGITSIAKADEPEAKTKTSVFAIGLTYNFAKGRKRQYEGRGEIIVLFGRQQSSFASVLFQACAEQSATYF